MSGERGALSGSWWKREGRVSAARGQGGFLKTGATQTSSLRERAVVGDVVLTAVRCPLPCAGDVPCLWPWRRRRPASGRGS